MKRGAATALAAALLSAAVVGLTDAPPAPTPTVQAASPLPRLPVLPAATDPGPALALLATTAMWGPRPVAGAAAAASAPPSPEPRWRISGTVWRQGQWRVVVQDDQRLAPTQLLAAGDALPDGRRVLEVSRDGVRAAAGRGRARAPAQWVDVPRRTPDP